MRESSRTRPAWSSIVTPLRVTRPALDFSTTRCRSAKAATCGRCVTTRTWAIAARVARRGPTSTAAVPPTPAWTSAKRKGGTGTGREREGPAGAGVELVEDEGGYGIRAGEDHLDGEHPPGKLAPRGAA